MIQNGENYKAYLTYIASPGNQKSTELIVTIEGTKKLKNSKIEFIDEKIIKLDDDIIKTLKFDVSCEIDYK